jgi:Family of unknown function (DUF6481)
MAKFQQPGIGERLRAAASAKGLAQKSFRARADVNDPEGLRKRAERLEQARARDGRLMDRKLARETQDAAELAARNAKGRPKGPSERNVKFWSAPNRRAGRPLWSRRKKQSATLGMRRGRSESSSVKKTPLGNLVADKAGTVGTRPR